MQAHPYITKTTTAYYCRSSNHLGSLVFIAICALTLLVSPNSYAQNNNNACSDVQIIFARGSGTELRKELFNRFDNQLRSRIDTQYVTTSTYELGTGWAGYDKDYLLYPAVSVSGAKAFTTGLGAQVSNGEGYRYGQSVNTGTNELLVFLSQINKQCPSTKFIIGGYSQGAHVIGNALENNLSKSLKENIVFVALFGDPKLYLPEGEGVSPPACKNENLSNYRRDVPDCRTDDGTLGARKPYVPSDLSNKAGLWCNNHDWICGSSKNALINSGHEKYADVGGPIDRASREAAERLAATLPLNKRQYVSTAMFLNAAGTPIKNVSYIWETNASSQQLYDYARASILAGANRVWHEGGRVALTPYQDNDFSSSFIHPVANLGGPSGSTIGLISFEDSLQITRRLDYYPHRDLAPYPGRGFLSAAATTLDYLPWQQGAEKATIYIAEKANLRLDTSYLYLQSQNRHVPIRDYLVQRAIEIDPVNLYFVLGNLGDADDARQIADATGGKVMTYDPDTPQTLAAAIEQINTEIANRPVVTPGSNHYTAINGEPTVLSVTSTVTSGSIIQYEWDYEGDGIWDETTLSPYTAHQYPDDFSGLTHIKATDSLGRIGTATVTITSEPPMHSPQALPAVTGIQYTILETKANTSKVRLSWNTYNATNRIALSIDGLYLGYFNHDQTSVTIIDINRDSDTTIALQPFDEDYNVGTSSGVIVPAIKKFHLPTSSDGALSSRKQSSPTAPLNNSVPITDTFTPLTHRDFQDNPKAIQDTASVSHQSHDKQSSLLLIALAFLITLVVMILYLYNRRKVLHNTSADS